MAAVKFLGYTIMKSQREREIQKLFEGYRKSLLEQKQKLCDDITRWADALILSIDKHANLQIRYLDQEYSRQVRDLNESRNQFIEDLRVREQMNDTEHINQLFEQCKALVCQLATLETAFQTIPYIEVPCKKKSVIKNQDVFDTTEIERIQIDNDSTEEDDDEVEDNIKSSPTSISTNAQQVNQQSIIIKTTNDGNRSTIRDNDMVEECPTCFMVFPSNMKPTDRTKHINGHFTND